MEKTAVEIEQMYQHADWKSEKHVPVIDCPEEVKAGELFEVKAAVGKEIAHPNTTEHHIQWITLSYVPEGDKFAYDLGHFAFNSHGASVEGANQGPAYTDPAITAMVKLEKSGSLIATSQCNIHGLWEFSMPIIVT
jgi:superoxide reductase